MEEVVIGVMGKLRHTDIEKRSGLGLHNVKPFCLGSVKEIKEIVVHEMRKEEEI